MSDQGFSAPPGLGEPDLLSDQPRTWPKVVGIISIVFASLGLVCGACGIIQNGSAFMSGGANMQTPSGSMQLPPPSLISLVLQGFGWFWSIVLLVAGITTLRRRPIGRILHLVYAAVSVVLTVVSTAVAWSDLQRTLQALQQDPKIAQMGGMIQAIAMGALCIGVLMGLGYPGFCLIWFGVVKKRASDMGPPPEEPVA